MSFNFTVKEFILGNGNGTPTLQFYKRGFNLSSTGSQPSWQDIILSGNTALTLVNSKANGLNYVKLFGKCEQRNIPSEYTQVEYLESSGGQKINTGLAGNDNYTIRAKFYDFGSGINCVVSGSDSRYGTNYIGRISGSGSNYRALLSNKKNSVITASIGLHTVEVTSQKITFDGTDYSWTADNNSIGQHLYLFYGYYSSEITAKIRLYYYQVELDGVLLRNFIPARHNSDNVLGMYDTVTGTFFTNAGTGDFTAGLDVTTPSPDNHMDIICNNGVLKVSPNLFDKYTAEKMYGSIRSDRTIQYVNTPGGAQAGCYEMKIEPNTQYTLSIAPDDTTIFRIISLASKWDGATTTEGTLIIYGTTETQYTFITPADASYIYFQTNYAKWETVLESIQLEQGSTATPYMPYGQIYTEGTTETVEVHSVNIIDTTQTRNATNSSEFWSSHKNEMTFNSANVWIWSVGENITTTSNYWNSSARSFAMPCKPGDVFLTKGYNGYPSATYARRTYSFVDANYKIISRDGWTTETVMTAPSNAAYFFIEWAVNDVNIDGWVITRNTALPTDYEPYFNGGNATAEMLLSVGNYKDVQSVLDGSVTRNIGIRVLNGSEIWSSDNNFNGYTTQHLLSRNNLPGFCNVCPVININSTEQLSVRIAYNSFRFQAFRSIYSTVEEFKSWLSNQYANGTPVILVYPLATPTEETVTPQPLSIQAGTNIITAEGSIDNLELEVSYKGKI